MWIAIFGLGAVIALVYIIAEFISTLVNDEFLIQSLLRHIRKKNILYKCDNCKKLYRNYQKELYRVIHGTNNCPHCHRYTGFYPTKMESKKWMDVHPDCPKASELTYRKLKNTMKEIEQNRKDNKDNEYFQEYNKLKVDLKWIENLQKKR